MMMQILEASGKTPIHQPAHNEFNPKGYYEIEDHQASRILAEIVAGKYPNHCIKTLIPYIGNGIIELANHVVFMQRDYDELIRSTEKKFGFSPYKRKLQTLEVETKKRLVDRDIKFTMVNYNKILENPRQELSRIEFLLKDLKSAVKAVDQALYNCKREDGKEIL